MFYGKTRMSSGRYSITAHDDEAARQRWIAVDTRRAITNEQDPAVLKAIEENRLLFVREPACLASRIIVKSPGDNSELWIDTVRNCDKLSVNFTIAALPDESTHDTLKRAAQDILTRLK